MWLLNLMRIKTVPRSIESATSELPKSLLDKSHTLSVYLDDFNHNFKMPVTVINQPTTWHTTLVNALVKFVTQVLGPGLQPSPDPYPHDPRKFMPSNFEKNLNVSVERFQPRPESTQLDFQDQEHWVPVVIRPNQTTKPKRFLLYWHGSAFVNMINPGHWIMLGKLAHELDAEIAVQTYVMAPHAGVHQNIGPILSIYELLLHTARENGQEFLIGGDR